MSAFEAIRLKPSFSVLASVLALHCGAGLTLFFFVPGTLFVVLGGLVVGVSLFLALRQQWEMRGRVLTIYADGGAALGDGESFQLVRVSDDAVILQHVLFVTLRGTDARPRLGTLRLMLVAGNMNAAQWRRLRIWLRHRAVRLASVSP